MCLELNKKSEVRVAKRNIIVYKRLYYHHCFSGVEFFNAIYQSFTYHLDKLVRVPFFSDENGFEFFQKLPKTANEVVCGLHSFTSLKTVRHTIGGSCTVKCIIPKGTLYIRGTLGETVSLALIPKEVVKWT